MGCGFETDGEMVRSASRSFDILAIINFIRRSTDGFNVYDPSLKPLPGTIYIGHLTESEQQIWCEYAIYDISVLIASHRHPYIQSTLPLHRTSHFRRHR